MLGLRIAATIATGLALAARFVALRTLSLRLATAALTLGFAAPCKGVENLNLGFAGLGRDGLGCCVLDRRFGNGIVFRGVFGRFRRLRIPLDNSFRRGWRGFHLRAFAFFGLIAKALHQVRELLKRHAGDRQHIGLGLKPATAVFDAQHIRQTFEHIDTDRPRSRGPVADHRVVFLRLTLNSRHRDQTGWRRIGEFLQALCQRPKQQAQPCRGRLQQKRHKDRELTKTHTVFAQGTPGILIQLFDFIGDFGTRDNPHRLDQLKREPARKAGQLFVF